MGRIILHNDGKYNVYSTVTDAPVFKKSITLNELRNWHSARYGDFGLQQLDSRLEMIHRKGTSSYCYDDLEDTIICNRAGDNEEELSIDEFIKRFL